MSAPIAVTGQHVGKATTRVEGRLKVTGHADYAVDAHGIAMSVDAHGIAMSVDAHGIAMSVDAHGIAMSGKGERENLAHAVLVGSTIASGTVKSIDTAAAEALPGVRLVLTHRNRGSLKKTKGSMLTGMPDSARLPLQDAKVHFTGQYVAMIVADTLEQAQAAAKALAITYETNDFAVTLEASQDAYKPARFQTEKLQVSRGHVDRDLEAADVRIDATYETPPEHPSPMELHGTVAEWNGAEELTVRNTTQWIMGDVGVLSRTFGLDRDKVHVHAPYLGGMFGSKAMTGGHVLLTVLAAKQLGRPVKCVLTREQVFTSVGHRARTVQRFELGARKDGRLQALRHTTTSNTSILDEFPEPTSITSRMLYDVPSYESVHWLKRTHLTQPGWMRAPGETPCQFAQESAIDELAVKLGIDPIVLRRRNDPQVNPDTGKPFSCKHALECFERGAERFGWRERGAVGSRREGHLQVGYGVAAATYPGNMMGAMVHARLERTGAGAQLLVQTAASDVGTGLYTVAAMVAAEALGLPLSHVTSQLGRSDYPFAAVAGGSNLTASVSPAVHEACTAIRADLTKLAGRKGSPLHGVDPHRLVFEDGAVHDRQQPATRASFAELLGLGGDQPLEARAMTAPVQGGNKKWSFQSFGAVFAEVTVDEDLHLVRVRRLLGVYDAGRIMNPKAARSQLLGGMVFGLGMALLEELVPDQAHGRFINANLADYRIPVNADMPAFDISFIDEPDLEFNPLGCRGIGEIGNPGTAAAIANAVYHATGKRIRSLPISPEKLMAAPSDLPSS